ncbi:DUF401 family protein [Candidatus Magnetomonas plexicatena]|uniref:DUF401 family protein n=1 Tax=Candidatus Magnetomonas plexicatena TaxID=2552947 RepID=UPI001103F1DF|nr:DUF401 family protein [Nitrospirales bacterium LBB_01]
MSDIVKILIVLALMVFLIRKKLEVGYVLLIASVVLFLEYLMVPKAIVNTAYAAIISKETFALMIALTFIRMVEKILRERDVLKEMMASVKGILRKKKFVIVSMPLLIGMLPSIGGAYFSCPMVEESAEGLNLSKEDMAFTNYWFRHPWEMVLPLYPGILLASIITQIGLRQFIFLNITCSLSMLVIGFIFGMKGIRGSFDKKQTGDIKAKRAIMSFLPIALLLFIVIVFKVKLHIAMVITVFSLFVVYRYGIREIYEVIKYGFKPDVIILIVGVMLFKETLQNSGAVTNLSAFFTSQGIPLMPLLVLLPFITGFLTGFTLAFVGSAFPLLLHLHGVDQYAFSFAFLSGYAGVLLSPVHVCFVVTREYFKADVLRLYKMVLPAVLILFIISLAQYVILR